MQKCFAVLLAAGVLTIAAAQPRTTTRTLTFNGRALTAGEMARLERVERYFRFRLPNLNYWYDNFSGAVGLWGGPTAGFMPAGLGLGGRMPAHCSRGGTGVFVNGRELHPIDVMALSRFMRVLPGRWWVDANGYGGPEGGPAMFNLVALSRQAQGGGRGGRNGWSHRVGGVGSSSHVGGDGDFFYFIDSDGTSLTIQ